MSFYELNFCVANVSLQGIALRKWNKFCCIKISHVALLNVRNQDLSHGFSQSQKLLDAT